MNPIVSNISRGSATCLLALALAGLAAGCGQARESAEDTTRSLTGHDAMMKGQELQQQLQQLGEEREKELEALK